MTAPIKIEAIEAISTAAAETSFATLASSRISGLTILTSDSMDVLISSKIRTDAIIKIKLSHSKFDILYRTPKTIEIVPKSI